MEDRSCDRLVAALTPDYAGVIRAIAPRQAKWSLLFIDKGYIDKQ
jgi:hypothetical protein